MHQFARQTDLLRQELHANAEENTSLVAEISERRAAEQKITALFRRLVAVQDEERAGGSPVTSMTNSARR